MKCPECNDASVYKKKYVGSTDHYYYCTSCMHTFGGEETPQKKALIKAAAYEDRG